MKRFLFCVSILFVLAIVLLLGLVKLMTPITQVQRDVAMAALEEVVTELTAAPETTTYHEDVPGTALSEVDRFAAYAALAERGYQLFSLDQWMAFESALLFIEYPEGYPFETEPYPWNVDKRAQAESAAESRRLAAANRDFIGMILETARLGGPLWRPGTREAYSIEKRQKSRERNFDSLGKLQIHDDFDAKSLIVFFPDLLLLDAHLRIEKDDLDGAAMNYVAALQLVAARRQSPGKGAFSIDLGFDDIYKRYSHDFGDGPPSKEAALGIIQALKQHGDYDLLARQFLNEMRERVTYREAWKQESFGAQIEYGGLYWGTRNWLWSSPVCRPLFNQDEALMANMATRMVEASAMPYHRAKPRLEKLQQEIEELPIFRHHTKQMMWDLPKIASFARLQAKADLMRLSIALDLHHAESGAYPKSLGEVEYLLGSTSPLNPFTGKPYHYRPMGDKYKLLAITERAYTILNLDFDFADYGADAPEVDDDWVPPEPEVELEDGQELLVWREGDWWYSYGGIVGELVLIDPSGIEPDGDVEAGGE
jgi:hypothetical protein